MGGRANPELVKRYRDFSEALKNTTEEQRSSPSRRRRSGTATGIRCASG
jgi:hypothetical protein